MRKRPPDLQEHLLIVGASARAAAFSALRANFRPWCVDFFGDADLKGRCQRTWTLPGSDFPNGFLMNVVAQMPFGYWIYTGGLENRPAVVRELATVRRLWGNDAEVLAQVRSPRLVAKMLQGAGLPCPAIQFRPGPATRQGRWLVKPLGSAGGTGIRFLTEELASANDFSGVYFQEFIEGEACAAIYLGDGNGARFLGATRQLVGESWLHAAPFHYCGSVGPLELPAELVKTLKLLGDTVTAGCGLRGLFGIDFILRDGVPWPVEINPRYTASVEVLEHSVGLPALAMHQQIFDSAAPVPPLFPGRRTEYIGKAILFAQRPITFPEEGPWMDTLRSPGPIRHVEPYADIPAPGKPIPARRPILTFFICGKSLADCLKNLQERAQELAPVLGQS